MRDPVIAADGHTYERAAIAQWLSTGIFFLVHGFFFWFTDS